MCLIMNIQNKYEKLYLLHMICITSFWYKHTSANTKTRLCSQTYNDDEKSRPAWHGDRSAMWIMRSEINLRVTARSVEERAGVYEVDCSICIFFNLWFFFLRNDINKYFLPKYSSVVLILIFSLSHCHWVWI
jgi:hypothetical protein